MSRKLVVLVIVLGIAALPLVASVAVDRIVLRVNDRVATLLDYQQRKADQLTALRRASKLTDEQREDLMKKAPVNTMRDIYQELLLLSRADQMDIHANQSQIDQAIAETRKNFGITNEEQFRAALAQSGMTEAQFRQQVARNLEIHEVVAREVASKIKVTPQEVRGYYDSHQEEFTEPAEMHLREVVVLGDDGQTPEEQRKIAADLRARLVQGRAMDDAVADYRKLGETSKAIDLGWVKAGDLDPAIAEAVKDLKPGEISQPVEGRGGLHIVQMIERKAKQIKPFKEVQSGIEAMERNRLSAKALDAYLRKLAAESYVYSDPPAEAAGFMKSAFEDSSEQDKTTLGPAATGKSTQSPPSPSGSPPASPRKAQGPPPPAP
ncbi:MAG TPA: peptidyl-prolyl cis-trans isomerase [Thermoanaerobaculia bacterium]|nr:peptidyl-prolyl cis-trans isomerase [Thermoanaerobaculia bacterium]